jgi:uroporphyrinogen decarboxylase
LGREKLTSFLKDDPELVFFALNRMAEGLSNLVNGLITIAKVDGIYLSVQNPSSEDFDRDFYHKFIGGPELSILMASQELGGVNILHICSLDGIRNRVKDYAFYPANAFNWSVNTEKITLRAARNIFQRKVLLGGFPSTPRSILQMGAREEIYRYTRTLVREIGDMRGIILGADCAIPQEVPLENLAYVKESATT